MRGADQIASFWIKKLPRQPVEFERDMTAAVKEGVDLTTEADHESTTAPALIDDIEVLRQAGLGQLGAATQGMPGGFSRRDLFHPSDDSRSLRQKS